MATNKDSTNTVEDMNRKPLEGEVLPSDKQEQSVSAATVYNLTIARKFVDAFNNDYNVTQACHYAGVSRDTYYRWLDVHPEFKKMCEEAKEMPLRRAREVVMKAIDDGDANMAMKYLQARDGDFTNKLKVDPSEKLAETRDKIKDFLDEPSDYGNADSSTSQTKSDDAGAEPAGGNGVGSGEEVASTTPDIS